MTADEKKKAIDYLKKHKSNCLIELEIKESEYVNFKTKNPGLLIDESHVHKIADKDKWGVELRLYYKAVLPVPKCITNLSTSNSRAGFEAYDNRINNNDLIRGLFENGFCIGKN